MADIVRRGWEEVTGLRQIEGENEVVSIVEWKSTILIALSADEIGSLQ